MEKLSNQVKVTEIGDVANRLSELFNKATNLQEDQFLKKAFAELQEKGKEITEAVKKDSVFSKLDDADTKRDDAVRVLDKLLKGYAVIPVENLKPHGEKLAEIFKKYGVKIVSENYTSESNLIDSLLAEFATPDAQTSVSALVGVGEALANLRTAQAEFAQIRSTYEHSLTEKQAKTSASTLRKPLLDLINKKISPYLVAMEIADKDKYSAFVSEASKIIISTNDAIKVRRKKKEKPTE